MSRKIKIEITESETLLLELIKSEKNGKNKEKLQILYWLKSRQVESGGHLAGLSGHHQTTISRWLSKYRSGGLEELLDRKSGSGKKGIISSEAIASLEQELNNSEGFFSYKEIQTWLKVFYDHKVSYSAVHKLVRYKLKAKLKVPRPVNCLQKEGAVEEFKKNSVLNKMLKPLKPTTRNYNKIRYWCQDESRFGLITMTGKKITGYGVQPVGIEQLKYDYLWLYGLVEPLTGDSFFYEFCHLDTVCFEKYLELFAERYPNDFHIIQLDNGGFHQALHLSLPEI